MLKVSDREMDLDLVSLLPASTAFVLLDPTTAVPNRCQPD